MAVRIRLRRMGAKKRPFYRLVVADSRTARDGRFIDQLGYYDPTTNPPTMKVDEEKAKLWLGRGAQPSDTARMLLAKAGALARVAAEPQPAAAEAAPEEAKPAPRKRRKAEPEVAQATVEVEAASAVESPVVPEATEQTEAEAKTEADAEAAAPPEEQAEEDPPSES